MDIIFNFPELQIRKRSLWAEATACTGKIWKRNLEGTFWLTLSKSLPLAKSYMAASPTGQPHPFCRVAWHEYLCLQLRFPTAKPWHFKETREQERFWTIFFFLQLYYPVSRFLHILWTGCHLLYKKLFHNMHKIYTRIRTGIHIPIYIFTHILFLLPF